jgi:transcriptional regulator with XRE-family HTH domain
MKPQNKLHELFRAMDKRRRALGMPYDILANRAGVSRPAVVRILSGQQRGASINNVFAIMAALDMWVDFGNEGTTQTSKTRQAQQKATHLMGLIQGTSALEGQGLDGWTFQEMKEQTVQKLVAGTRRRLWE